MDIRDIIWLSLKQLKEKRVRTALSVLMVVIGVAAIVALTSQTAGIGQKIQATLSSLGPTSIIVTASGSTAFTSLDIANLETLPNVSSVTPIVTGQATLLANGNTTSVTVIGVTTQGLDLLLGGNISIYQGSLYENNVAPLAVIGHSVAFSSSTDANLQTVDVGQTGTLEISSQSRGGSAEKIAVPVVGILESYTSILPIDGSVIVSMPFAEVLLNKLSFNEMLIKATNTSSVSSLSSLVTTVYGSNARVLDTARLASTASSIIGSISALFTIIAGVSLLVAAIGIMNVMLMSVYERIHEIGIYKAVGFKNREVMLIFLFQALIIGLLGGILGLGTGAGVSYALASVLSSGASASSTASATSAGAGASSFRAGSGGAGGFSARSGGGFGGGAGGASGAGGATLSLSSYQPVFTLSIIAEAILIAVAVSALAGVYPAWKASKMEPIDALREL
jgi:ABC-type antimicrobial peptide transport system permease subunit